MCSATSLYHNQLALFKLSNLVHIESRVLSVAGENQLIFHRKSHGLSEGGASYTCRPRVDKLGERIFLFHQRYH